MAIILIIIFFLLQYVYYDGPALWLGGGADFIQGEASLPAPSTSAGAAYWMMSTTRSKIITTRCSKLLRAAIYASTSRTAFHTSASAYQAAASNWSDKASCSTSCMRCASYHQHTEIRRRILPGDLHRLDLPVGRARRHVQDVPDGLQIRARLGTAIPHHALHTGHWSK